MNIDGFDEDFEKVHWRIVERAMNEVFEATEDDFSHMQELIDEHIRPERESESYWMWYHQGPCGIIEDIMNKPREFFTEERWSQYMKIAREEGSYYHFFNKEAVREDICQQCQEDACTSECTFYKTTFSIGSQKEVAE